MPFTGMEGHQLGSTLVLDRWGNVTDISATFCERFIALGYAWRFGTGLLSLPALNDRAFLSFKTPVTGEINYAFSSINKSGDEVQFSINEGGVIANGTAITPWNLNRVRGDAACPFTQTFKGTSKNAPAMTLTGGTDAPTILIPGSGIGSSRPGGSASGAPFLRLKNNTVYTLWIVSSIGAAFVEAHLDMAQVIGP